MYLRRPLASGRLPRVNFKSNPPPPKDLRVRGQNPDPPTLAFFDFLAFFVFRFSLLFWCVFPFFSKDFSVFTKRKTRAFFEVFLAVFSQKNPRLEGQGMQARHDNLRRCRVETPLACDRIGFEPLARNRKKYRKRPPPENRRKKRRRKGNWPRNPVFKPFFQFFGYFLRHFVYFSSLSFFFSYFGPEPETHPPAAGRQAVATQCAAKEVL